MKPIALTMQAFGPYAQKQELDFGQLQGRSFFLIHGPTGSGKTTILDAICYALYGDTSGAIRDGKSMRSDHADVEVPTQVCFDFVIGQTIYRAERSPEQERPKKSGQGMTKVRPEATLRQVGETDDAVLAAGWDAVTRYVEKILGFKSSQFRQVVLLPQGDFRRLLIANSAERQEIMQTLFKTELFQVIEEKLKSKAIALKQQYDALTQQFSWVLNEAAATSVQQLSDRLASDLEQTASVAKLLREAEQSLKQAQEELAMGKIAQACFDELTSSEAVLTKLNARVEAISQERSQLTRGQKAFMLAESERLVLSLTDEAAKCQQQVAQYQKQQQEAILRQRSAQQRLAAENKREPEREEALFQLQKLQEIEIKAALLKQAESAVEQAKLKLEQAVCHKAKTSQTLKNSQEAIAAQSELYQQAINQSGETEACRLAIEAAEQKIARRRMLDTVRKELSDATNQFKLAQDNLRRQDDGLVVLKRELLQMQSAWEKEQAAILASHLADGAACPVCGSRCHPAKAASVGLLPDALLIKNRQAQVQAAENRRDELRQKAAKAEAEHATLSSREKDLESELQQAAFAPIAELAAALHQLREKYQIAIQAKREGEALASSLEQLRKEQEGAEENLAKVDGEHRAAEGKLQAAEAVAADRRESTPEQYRDIKVVKAAQAAAADRLKKLKAAFEQAKQEFDQANQMLIQTEAALTASIAASQNSETKLKDERISFFRRVMAAGFSSLPDYQSAKQPPVALKQLEQRIIQFDNQLAAAIERQERAQAAVANLVQPDLASLNHAIQLSMAAYNTALAEHTTLAGRKKRTEEWLHRLAEIEQSLQQVESKYLVYGRLAEVAIGRNEFGLTFQRFVLGALLDDVAIAANERLKAMSRGRYQLQRTMDRARRNSAGGLELEVFDNYTGCARPVTTLSGGETFLASLALALGLADVVQSYAGGIHLDAIFVDEGFGALDPETLEFALQALIALQQGGRMVGIISHVPELKDRIDARIEIAVAAKGSKASFKLS